MSIISQIGVVILIVFIVVVLIRANKNLKKVSEEGENFVDEWALREEKKEELREKREEKKRLAAEEKERLKLEKQARKERRTRRSAKPQEEEYEYEDRGVHELRDEFDDYESEYDAQESRDDFRQEDQIESGRDWLSDYAKEETDRLSGYAGRETDRFSGYAGKETEWLSGYAEEDADRAPVSDKIVPMKKRIATGITLMKLDENHRVMGRYRVGQIPFTIGRGNNNNLVLDDLCVARNHCRIVEKDGNYVLEDAGTMNKLYVNGMVTASVPLSDGLRIYIGNEEFQVEMEGGRSQSTRLYRNIGMGSYE